MTPDAWRSSGKYFNHGSHRIFYRMEGEGAPLLLVHGFPTAGWDWHRVWPSLIQRYQVIAADMIGFGFSDKPENYPYSIMDQADLHAGLLDELGISRVHILAHDYGDTVVQELLARQQSAKGSFTIASVCFLNGGLFPGVHRPRPIQNILMSPVGFLLTPFLGKSNLAKTFHRIFGPGTRPDNTEIDQFWQLIEYNRGKRILYRLIRYMAERREHEDRWVGALVNSAVPMRLVDGGADPISGKHLADHYLEVIPDPDVVVLENIGHYPQTEAPEQVLEHYFAFREAPGH